MNSIWLETSKRLMDIEQCIKGNLAVFPVLSTLPMRSIYVLASLYEKDHARATDIARSIHVVPTSFTPVLDRLEGVGLITRSSHPTDRRSVILSLTPEGKRYRIAIEDAIISAEAQYGAK